MGREPHEDRAMPRPLRPLPAALAALMLLAAPAAAQGMDAQYELTFRGLTAGQIGMRATEAGGAYAVSSAVRSAGLGSLFGRYSYTGQAQGVVRGGTHVATRYEEREDDDGELTGSVTTFERGAPATVTFTPPREPRPYDVAPAEVGRAVDLLTGLYLLLRDVPPAGACAQSHTMFDGRHVTRVTLGAPSARADGTIACAAEYRRVAGYDPEEMARRPASPMAITYGPAGNGAVRVTEIRAPTPLGDAVLRRR